MTLTLVNITLDHISGLLLLSGVTAQNQWTVSPTKFA